MDVQRNFCRAIELQELEVTSPDVIGTRTLQRQQTP